MQPLTVIITEEQLLENRIEFLRQKFEEPLEQFATKDRDRPLARDGVFNYLLNIDPSPNKKFLQWLIKLYLNGKLMLEDGYKAKEYLELFLKNNAKLPPEMRDINRYKDLNILYDTIRQYEEVKSKREVNRELDQKMHGAEHIELIYNSPTMKVVQLKSQAAACYFGTNTKWCTAAQYNNMFDRYNKSGPIFVVIVKKEDIRFQLHYASGQFMDETDRPINMLELGEKYPEIKTALGVLFNKAVVTQNPAMVLQLENPEPEIVEQAFFTKPDLLLTVSEPTEDMMRGAIKKDPTVALDILEKGVDIPEDLRIMAATSNFGLARNLARDSYYDAREKNEETIDEHGVTIQEQFNQEGLTLEVMLRCSEVGDEVGLNLLGYEPEHGFIIEKYITTYERDGVINLISDVNGFVTEWIGEGTAAAFAANILSGDDNFEIYELPSNAVVETLDELPKERRQISEYLYDKYIMATDENGERKYPELEDYEDMNMDDSTQLMEFLRSSEAKNAVDEAESIIDALVSAAYTGNEEGSSDEMIKDFYEWLDRLSNDSSISAVQHDHRGLYVYVDTDTAVDILSESQTDQYPPITDWKELEEFPKFQSPQYGWFGFSVSAASDRLRDELYSYGIFK